MRSLLLVVFLASAALANPYPFDLAETEIEKHVNDTMTCVTRILGEGDASLGLPPHNPLVSDEIVFDLDQLGLESLISGKVVIKDQVFSGITWWDTTHIKIRAYRTPPDTTKVHFEITWEWPLQTIVGQYEADVTALGIHIDGAGSYNATITNVVVQNVIDVTLPTGHLDGLSVRPTVEDIDFEINGLKVNGKDRSRIISLVVSSSAGIINELTDVIEAVIEYIALKLINENNYAISDRLDVFKELIKRCW